MDAEKPMVPGVWTRGRKEAEEGAGMGEVK